MKKEGGKYVFSILIKNPEYTIWCVYILIASISFIIGMIEDCESEIEKGSLYFISMSIIAPLFIDFLILNVETRKFKIENYFLTRKTITLGLCCCILFLDFIFILTKLKSNIGFQIIMYVLSIVLSLYMFCLNKLHLRYDEFSQLDDKPYHDEINEKSQELSELKDKTKIINDEGKEIKL